MDYGSHRALDGLRLSVEEGRVYGLLGPNGAGKSTTIHLVTGLLQPTSGRITVGGIDAVSNPEQARDLLAYVPESVALYPHLSGIENLQLFSRLAGQHFDVGASVSCLEGAGLQAQAHHRRVDTYSKGMRQKVGLAIALAKGGPMRSSSTSPSSGLDPSASHDLALGVRELASNGVAVGDPRPLPGSGNLRHGWPARTGVAPRGMGGQRGQRPRPRSCLPGHGHGGKRAV